MTKRGFLDCLIVKAAISGGQTLAGFAHTNAEFHADIIPPLIIM
jgi:hypothetical protein